MKAPSSGRLPTIDEQLRNLEQWCVSAGLYVQNLAGRCDTYSGAIFGVELACNDLASSTQRHINQSGLYKLAKLVNHLVRSAEDLAVARASARLKHDWWFTPGDVLEQAKRAVQS